jgi:hypothetical protein
VGIEAENHLREIKVGNKTTFLSTRTMLWTQPQNQQFKTSKSKLGGLLEAKYNYPIYKNVLANIALTVKTNGWVAGNEYLNSNLNFSLGVAMLLNK